MHRNKANARQTARGRLEQPRPRQRLPPRSGRHRRRSRIRRYRPSTAHERRVETSALRTPLSRSRVRIGGGSSGGLPRHRALKDHDGRTYAACGVVGDPKARHASLCCAPGPTRAAVAEEEHCVCWRHQDPLDWHAEAMRLAARAELGKEGGDIWQRQVRAPAPRLRDQRPPAAALLHVSRGKTDAPSLRPGERRKIIDASNAFFAGQFICITAHFTRFR